MEEETNRRADVGKDLPTIPEVVEIEDLENEFPTRIPGISKILAREK